MAAVGLGDQQGQVALRQQLGVAPYFGFDVRGVVVRVEVARRYDTGDVAGGAFEVALPGAGDQRHGDAVPDGLVAQGGEVAGPVLAVEEVQLVLQLHHDHRSVRRVLALGEERQRLVEPGGDPVEEARLVLTDPQLGVRPSQAGSAPPSHSEQM